MNEREYHDYCVRTANEAAKGLWIGMILFLAIVGVLWLAGSLQ